MFHALQSCFPGIICLYYIFVYKSNILFTLVVMQVKLMIIMILTDRSIEIVLVGGGGGGGGAGACLHKFFSRKDFFLIVHCMENTNFFVTYLYD